MHACRPGARPPQSAEDAGKDKGQGATCGLAALEECSCWWVMTCSKSWKGLPPAEAKRRTLCSYSTSTSVRNLRMQQRLADYSPQHAQGTQRPHVAHGPQPGM